MFGISEKICKAPLHGSWWVALFGAGAPQRESLRDSIGVVSWRDRFLFLYQQVTTFQSERRRPAGKELRGESG